MGGGRRPALGREGLSSGSGRAGLLHDLIAGNPQLSINSGDERVLVEVAYLLVQRSVCLRLPFARELRCLSDLRPVIFEATLFRCLIVGQCRRPPAA